MPKRVPARRHWMISFNFGYCSPTTNSSSEVYARYARAASEKPQRRIHRVVLRFGARVGKAVGQHASTRVFREFMKNRSGNIMPSGNQSDAGQSDHGVPSPVAEPVVPGYDRLPIAAVDDVLVRRPNQTAHEWRSDRNAGRYLRPAAHFCIADLTGLLDGALPRRGYHEASSHTGCQLIPHQK